uniref:NADH-ubiquinone oxidoreductase chain 1 n=1 Tax=Janus sp. 1 GYN-2022e TaxID=3003421 RepID=A0A9E9C4S4_9HYME|nr:NADH dehydrogenase subunit 1 [Janus sp. 1 GYN-2022e]
MFLFSMIYVEFMIVLIVFIILMVNVLICVAFLTLYERKILGYIQMRKGPNKVGVIGVVQAFSDAIKLFSKECLIGYNFNYLMFLFSPMFVLMMGVLVWVLCPFLFNIWELNLGLLMMLSVFSVGVYFIMYSGWASNSLYSLLGALRAIAQSISYEVSLALILVIFVFLSDSFNFVIIMFCQINLFFGVIMMPLFFMFVVSSLAELNRAPFDFVEGESELVSGFNVEYSSGLFAFLFLGEYSMILFFSVLWVSLFVGVICFNLMYYFLILLSFSLVIVIRGTYARFRYDKLMMLAWKNFLPMSLLYLMYILGVKMCVLYLML